jgi:GWxTD domain-containing protein
MNIRSLRLITALATVLVVSLPAFGQLSETYRDWADGPAGYLLTKDELKDWKNISTDAQAKKFIALFWAMRNPTLGDAFNPFKAEFEARVRYADENFTSDLGRGALSDRGRTLILLGLPHQAERRGPTETVELMDNTVAGSDEVRANVERWVYDPARLPDGFKVRGSRLAFVFYEDKPESNRFILDRSHQESTMAMRSLSKAPEVYVLHPDLKEVPKPVSIPNAETADAAALAWFDATEFPQQESLRSLVEVGMADASHRPVWVHLELPTGAPRIDAIAGRVLAPDGEVESTFQTVATAIPTATGIAYHLTFPLDAGDHRLEIAGATGNTPQFKLEADVTVPEVPIEGTWMSPLWVGLSAEMEEGSPLGQAFTFGGWHLRPLAGGDVPHQSEVSFFGFIVRPGRDDAGATKLVAKIAVKKGTQKLGPPFTMPLEAAQLKDDLYLYANAISISGLPEPGDYTLSFTISDEISDIEVEKTVDLHVVD